jgi:hypothetical protein
MSMRWSFVFILLSLCIIGVVADDWNQQRGNLDPQRGNWDQQRGDPGHHSTPNWYYSSPYWNYPSWNYNSWYWDSYWQPSNWSWSYYSTPVWSYTTPVVQYTTPAYVNWNTCEICFPATTVGSKAYYSLSMTRYYSVGSTSLAFPVGLWW